MRAHEPMAFVQDGECGVVMVCMCPFLRACMRACVRACASMSTLLTFTNVQC